MSHLKRLFSLLLACALFLTGCGDSGTSDASGEKINVFTSQNFQATGFVIQLVDDEHLELAHQLIGGLEEQGTCPITTPDYILQFSSPEVEEDDYWWLWTGAHGVATLVHKSVDETVAYVATDITGHQWGEMISKVTEGKGPV